MVIYVRMFFNLFMGMGFNLGGRFYHFFMILRFGKYDILHDMND